MPATPTEVMERVRDAWRCMAAAPEAFRGAPVAACMPDGQGVSPPGWVGVVELEGDVLLSLPEERMDDVLRRLRGRLDADLADPDVLLSLLGGVDDMLGPAVLAYREIDAGVLRSADARAVAVDDPAVLDLFAACAAQDVAESALANEGMHRFVSSNAAGVAAVAGYGEWPGGLAHLGVLAHPTWRRRGLAAAAASAAIAAAIDAGLVPQWRSRRGNHASRALAARLGFIERGRQLSVLLAS